MKNKSVHSCRFFHHAKFHCIITTLNKLFKVEFESGQLEKSQKILKVPSNRNLIVSGLILESSGFEFLLIAVWFLISCSIIC